jgi:hypothetical protein
MTSKNKYILLREATKYCNYSQSYLSLRARQGKLKAKKIKRNWYATKEWLQDYLDNIAEKGKKERIVIKPPEKLPIETENERLIEPVVEVSFSFPRPLLLAVFFTSLLLLSSVFFFSRGISFTSFQKEVKAFEKELVVTTEFIATEDVQASTFEVFKNYGDWLIDGTKKHLTKIGSGEYFYLAKEKIVSYFSEEEIVLEEKKEEAAAPELKEDSDEEKGVVVFSSEEKKTEEDIKKSFSDEVEIKSEDNISGIIIPIFEKGKGQEYFYLMVPVNENE